MKKLVIMASGSGSNFQAIIDSIHCGKIQAEIAGLITNREDAGAIDRAKKNDIPVKIVSTSSQSEFSNELKKQFETWNPDLVVLAGFLKKIPDEVVHQYSGRIINIHPSLLPKYGGKGFFGRHVHKAVLESGDTQTGCTVHYVNEQYDKGDIIAQKKVDIKPSDTPESLAKRVLKEEHKLLPYVIKQLLTQHKT